MIVKNLKKYDLLAILFYIVCYTIIFSFYSILRHISFHTSTFDFGIFNQIFWNMVHNGTQTNTLETAQTTLHLLRHGNEFISETLFTPRPAVPINHLGVHFSLILYLLAPIYAIFQSPKTLLISQSFMLGLGALPLYLIAKKKTQSILFSQAICLTYLLYPTLPILSLYDFHEFSFAPVLILSTLYFLETNKYKYFWLFFALTLFIKEELALSGFFIGLYIALGKKERKLGVLVSLVSLIYFIVTIKIFMPFFGQPYNFSDRYLEFASSTNDSYSKIIYNILSQPLHTLKYIFFNVDKLSYLKTLFLPVLLLPLFSGISFILLIPSLLINLLSSFPPQYSIYYQYTAVIIPFLFFTTIIGYNNISKKFKKYREIIPYALLVLSIITALTNIISLTLNHTLPIPPRYHQDITLANIIKKIPPNASVAGAQEIIPQFAERKEVWLFPAINNAEYALFDISENANYSPAGYINTFAILKNLLRQKKYGVLDFTENYILLKKGFSTSKNDQALLEVTKRFQLIKK